MTPTQQLRRMHSVKKLRVALARKRMSLALIKERRLNQISVASQADADTYAQIADDYLDAGLKNGNGLVGAPILLSTLSFGYAEARMLASRFQQRADRRAKNHSKQQTQLNKMVQDVAKSEARRDRFETFLKKHEGSHAAKLEQLTDDENTELAAVRTKHGFG